MIEKLKDEMLELDGLLSEMLEGDMTPMTHDLCVEVKGGKVIATFFKNKVTGKESGWHTLSQID